MKKYLLFLVATMILFNQEVIAQKKAPHHHKAKVVKQHRQHKHRYVRSKVVVVHPRKSRVLVTMPAGHAVIVFKGNNHYYHNGLFYRYHANAYHLFAPPVGIRIAALPLGHHRILFAGKPYFYYGGVYYAQQANEYEVVEPKQGMTVPELPEENVEEITIDGQNYYAYDDILYKKVVTTEGVAYEVVGKLED